VKIGDLVIDKAFHHYWNPKGDVGNRVGIVLDAKRFRCEVLWTDNGPDRFVDKKDLELISENR
jgi:hypothetical protein